MTNSRLLFLILLVVSSSTIAHSQSVQSLYTDLDAKKCRTIESTSEEGGSYVGKCPGVGGFSLIVTEGDLRQNITVVTPKKAEHSLELWTVVSSAFSSLGPKAEWRVVKQKNKTTPVALIVRYNASEDPEHPDKTTSYLVVTKITSKEICVTDRIKPGAKANEEARLLADEEATKPCLKDKH